MKTRAILLLVASAAVWSSGTEIKVSDKSPEVAGAKHLSWPEIAEPQVLIDFARLETKKITAVNRNFQEIDLSNSKELGPQRFFLAGYVCKDFVVLLMDTHPFTGQAIIVYPDKESANSEKYTIFQIQFKAEDTSIPEIKRTLMRVPTERLANSEDFKNSSIHWRDVRKRDMGSTSWPKSVEFAVPLYPYAMIRAGINGETKIEFTVTENGEVDALQVTGTHKEFETAVRDAAKLWRFEPGVDLMTRLPVATHLSLTAEFILED